LPVVGALYFTTTKKLPATTLVIANEAKQSSVILIWIASSLFGLLAMTVLSRSDSKAT